NYQDDAAQNERPFSGDLLAQSYRGDDFEQAYSDGPHGNVEKERQRGDTRRGEGHDAHGNAEEPLEEQDPPRLVEVTPFDGHPSRENADRKGVDGKQEDQRGE